MNKAHIFIIILFSPAVAVMAATPGRPADFKPFQCEYTTEQLMEKSSSDQMRRAEDELKQMQAGNDKRPWKLT